jgi:TonB family protein
MAPQHSMQGRTAGQRTVHAGWMILGALLVLGAPVQARWREPNVGTGETSHPNIPRVGEERAGMEETRNGLRLHLSADLGDIKILTASSSERPRVRYKVRIETDARNREARKLLKEYSLAVKSTLAGVWITGTTPSGTRERPAAQFWVNFEVAVPPDYDVDVSTQGGDIETQDIGGAASLVSQGGNITAGRIGMVTRVSAAAGRPVARLETQGGHINVLDVAGDLHAYTAGGHINARNVSGDAVLHTAGGHIRADRISGKADLETGGGNITVREVRSSVAVRTAGGQIDFGEAYGSVRAHTGGGGIRVVHVAGPIELETSDGSICLTKVAGSVRAATGSGTITAWISPEAPQGEPRRVMLSGASLLESGQGDIVVYLPRKLAATIEAVVESGGEKRIQADPALPLKVSLASARGSGPVRAEAALNGGGEVLRLKTGSGTIRLQFLDSDSSLREMLVREQTERIEKRLDELMPSEPESAPQAEIALPQRSDWFRDWMNRLEERIYGGISIEPEELQKLLSSSVKPVYPEVARRAGVQGLVRLQIRVNRQGRVEVQKVVEGEPILADAAIQAAQRWRYKPIVINGKPANVISTVTFNFVLH